MSSQTSCPTTKFVSVATVAVMATMSMTALLWLHQKHIHSSKSKTGQSSSPSKDDSTTPGCSRNSTTPDDSPMSEQEVPLQRRQEEEEGHESDDDSDKDDDDDDEEEDNLHLPQHMEREFYKDQRRRQMIPHLSMKKTMYDNIRMLDPNGHHLCNISMKKANWYINKNIAQWIQHPDNANNANNTNTKDCIQLSFHPKMATTRKDPNLVTYNRGPKVNQCVVCGVERDYMRHYVVPHCYRSLLPVSFKTHLPHDVVLLCAADCHVRAERRTHQRMMRMERKLRTDPETEQPQILDRQLHHIQSSAQALWKWKDKLPEHRIVEYQDLLVDWFQLDCIDALTDQHLTLASQIEARRPNPKYIPGPHLVMEHLVQKSSDSSTSSTSDKLIAQFVREWRLHFLQTMQPRFLPIGWSVDSPVQCDGRPSD